MPIYDYECQECGFTFEYICKPDYKPSWLRCRVCRATSRPIITASGQYCGNQDADWIKSVREVVGDETREGREFKRDPTRANYKAWMEKKGLRPLEDNEPKKPEPYDESSLQHKVALAHLKRNRIEVY